QGETHEIITVFAKANARAYGNLGLLQQLLREFQGSHCPILFRYCSPDKHCGLWLLNIPAGAVQPIAERIATTAVDFHDFTHALLRPTQGCNRSDLDWLKSAIVQVTFHARQRMNDFAIADAKTHSPTRHAVTL